MGRRRWRRRRWLKLVCLRRQVAAFFLGKERSNHIQCKTMTFNFRPDDYIIASMSAFLIQAVMPLWEAGEQKGVVPRLTEPARELWRENRTRWLITVLPAVIFSIFAVFFCLRLVIPENEKQTSWILAGVCVAALVTSTVRWFLVQHKVEEHTNNAMVYLKQAEDELAKLTEGPVIQDEQLDAQILSLKKQVIDARAKLGLPSRDPNDR